jgi:hypothetical protein
VGAVAELAARCEADDCEEERQAKLAKQETRSMVAARAGVAILRLNMEPPARDTCLITPEGATRVEYHDVGRTVKKIRRY